MKKLTKERLSSFLTGGLIMATLGGLVGLLSYAATKRDMPIKTVQIDGYSVTTETTGEGRKIMITIPHTTQGYPPVQLFAEDYDNDGRFDEILMWNVPKGHPLEIRANTQDLERLYQMAMGK